MGRVKTVKIFILHIKTSIEEALVSPFINPLENISEVYINEFYFICNGKLNDFARRYIQNLLQTRNFPNFKIIDIDKISDLIKKLISVYAIHIDKAYIFDVNNFDKFCINIVSFKEQFESKKIGANIFI